ncbi:MAG: hypothetical protein CSA20_05445 [Deltaproteobacteria bacterium]|nr:MAG: hypothetical protein CSB23_03345 [Deltaproteobacteria bacterium]PIE72912.1 MAG: hypothetical protein CSA20_05445 [Deltaproteobacteria bacterium]
MKKGLITILILAVAFLAVIPWLGGMITESTIQEQVAKTNQIYSDIGQRTNIEIVEYNRGFGASTFLMKLTDPILAKFFGIQEILIDSEAKHGITGIDTTSSLQKNSWYKDFIDSKLGGKDPLHTHTRYSYLGNVTSDVQLDECSLASDRNTFTIKAGNFTSTADKELTNFTIKGDWKGLEAAFDEGTIQLGPSTLKGDMKLFSPYIWKGSMEFAAQELQAGQEAETFTLTGPRIEVKSDISKDGATMSVEEKISFDQLQIEEEKVESFSGSVIIKNINVKAYEEFIKAYSKAMEPIIDTMLDDPEKDPQIAGEEVAATMLGMLPLVEKLLSKDLEIRLSNIHLTLPEGEIKADVRLQLLEDVTLTQFISMSQKPGMFLDIFSLASDISFPKALAEDNDSSLFQPLLPGMQTGFFVIKDDKAVHTAEIRDGKLYLNDKEVPLQ